MEIGYIKPIKIIKIQYLELKFITPYVTHWEISQLWQSNPNIIKQCGELYAVERYINGNVENLPNDIPYYAWAIKVQPHQQEDLIISNKIFAGGQLNLSAAQQDYMNEWNRLFDYVKPSLSDINNPFKFFPYSLEYYNSNSSKCIQMLPIENIERL